MQVVCWVYVLICLGTGKAQQAQSACVAGVVARLKQNVGARCRLTPPNAFMLMIVSFPETIRDSFLSPCVLVAHLFCRTGMCVSFCAFFI